MAVGVYVRVSTEEQRERQAVNIALNIGTLHIHLIELLVERRFVNPPPAEEAQHPVALRCLLLKPVSKVIQFLLAALALTVCTRTAAAQNRGNRQNGNQQQQQLKQMQLAAAQQQHDAVQQQVDAAQQQLNALDSNKASVRAAKKQLAAVQQQLGRLPLGGGPRLDGLQLGVRGALPLPLRGSGSGTRPGAIARSRRARNAGGSTRCGSIRCAAGPPC